MHSLAKISLKPVPGLTLKSFSVLLVITQLVIQKPFAQISEDFSDGNFTVSPSWSGTDTAFHVNELFQLQLNSTAAGTSWLVTDFPLDPMQNIQWEFFVKQSFSPSGANFGRFYLASDQADLSGPLNGYYLQFGEAGSNDAVELFRQSGTTRMSVCRATAAAIAASFELRVKVTRDAAALWELSVAYSGGRNFVLEASATDVTHTDFRYGGMLCTYTITNATRFYYDDIFISTSPAPDVTSPQMVSLQVTSSRSLRLVFSEHLDKASAENVNHYFVSPAIGNAVSALLQEDQKTVDLSFSADFLNGHDAILRIENVKDLSGNILPPTESGFLYFAPQPVNFKDVIFSEFLPDPSPVVGLPEAEFAEILNRSENAIDLSGWTLADGSGSAWLASHILLPREYLILASPANAEKFASLGEVLPVPGFPSLNNAGDKLILRHHDGGTIDSLTYDISWYQDGEKADGGWSLELIDPGNICADNTNWTAAETDTGGSPGKQNSVFANKPDNTGPRIVSVIPVTATTLVIAFNEKLEITVPDAGAFTTDPVLRVNAVRFEDASLRALQLSLADTIEPSTHYTIIVRDVYDCPGNKIQEDFSRAVFVLPEKAAPGDILVNEILFNPRPTGVDFVEVYNQSDKSIDLRNWSLRNFTASASSAVISHEHFLIHSKEYKVFTENKNVLKGEYLSGIEHTFSETVLPPFNDDDGSLAIIDEHGMLIDSMVYSDKMHASFVKDDEGISLERISFSVTAGERSNWRSASSASGFATPGYVNSNVRSGLQPDEGSVTVEPEIIRPNVHAHDFAQIKYRFGRGGFIANVRIQDQQGRPIREIAGNELLGTDGFFRWDGDLDDGSPARTGYYMVWFEIFDDSGMLITYRERVAVF